MSSGSMMTVQAASQLLRKIVSAKDGQELEQIVASNIHTCDGIFFGQLNELVTEYTRRGDLQSAQKLKGIGDYMARLRFMI